MPVVPHPSFAEPPERAVLWRYMDLAKFCALLTGGQLWFPTAEALATDDPHEAILPPGNYAHRSWSGPSDVPSADLAKIEGTSYGPHDWNLNYKIEREKQNRDMNIRRMFIYRRSYFVSCWHGLSYESAAMWKIYGAPGPGIAVETTVGCLKKALAGNAEDLYLGYVRYVNDATDIVDTTNGFNAALTKRAHFGYEHEVRVIYSSGAWADIPGVIWDPQSGFFRESPLLDQYERRPQPIGRSFPVDLQELIKGVWVSPYSQPWYDDVVRKLCSTFGVGATLRRSKLLAAPPR